MPAFAKFIAITLVFAVTSACGFHKSPSERAAWFFDKGENVITDSLEDNGASKTQLAEVKKILSSHRAVVTTNMEKAMTSHKDILKGIMAGKNDSELVQLEELYHAESSKTLRSIGKMHSELENIVGNKIWRAAASQREKKFSRHQ